MFGISLTEVAMIALVALVVVGPQKLPGMLRTLGEWVRKIRQMTTAVRAQTGIDDILREEGIDGGLAELRNLVRGDLGSMARARRSGRDRGEDDPYEKAIELDRFREYPIEGVDAAGALPDDLVDEDDDAEEAAGEIADESEKKPDESEADDEASETEEDAKPEAIERESTKAPWQVDRKK